VIMNIPQKQLEELVVPPGHISQKDFTEAVAEANKSSKSVEDLLVQKGLIADKQLGRLIAEKFGFNFLDLSSEKVSEETLYLIPELVAKTKGVIAVSQSESGLRVAMTNPNDLETIQFIEKRTGQNVLPYFVTQQSLRNAFSVYQISLHEKFKGIVAQLRNMDLSRVERDKAAVQMVDTLLEYGYQNKASDIHIEPYTKKIVVRFRIDGVMHDVLEIPKELADLILSRIKILAKMRTDEHLAAQDGKLRFQRDQEMVDMRVSIVPVTQGENVVIRILSAQNRRFSLADLGFLENDLKKVQKATRKPHGMILVTGPTGSGKTTTLYAIVKILDKREIHIATIEDPVEYDIDGVSQIQVNTKTNLTFAKGLRAIVRQDPDIIMVGEIRDEETARIAVNSAMTGHLVLSTLHANDSSTTLPRLLDMKIEPFLITSTVNVAIAQRLVRKICEKCRVSYQLDEVDQGLLEV